MSTEAKKAVLAALKEREEEWVTAKTLARSVGSVDEKTFRDLRLAVAELREAGVPVVSGRKGFMLTSDPKVVLDCVVALERRRIGLEVSICALAKTWSVM